MGVRQIFKNIDFDRSGFISLDEINSTLHLPAVDAFLSDIHIDKAEAKGLFKLSDVDQSGSIDMENFLDGVCRLRQPANRANVSLILLELRALHADLVKLRHVLKG